MYYLLAIKNLLNTPTQRKNIRYNIKIYYKNIFAQSIYKLPNDLFVNLIKNKRKKYK